MTNLANRILRKPEVLTKSGMRGTQLDLAVDDEEFPQPVKLRDDGRSIGWYADEIEAWLEFRRAKRDELFRGTWKQWWADKIAASAA
jgi:predicted DNA-binding transcriptional regulator AlpA